MVRFSKNNCKTYYENSLKKVHRYFVQFYMQLNLINEDFSITSEYFHQSNISLKGSLRSYSFKMNYGKNYSFTISAITCHGVGPPLKGVGECKTDVTIPGKENMNHMIIKTRKVNWFSYLNHYLTLQ